jgi:hypothetical protein
MIVTKDVMKTTTLNIVSGSGSYSASVKELVECSVKEKIMCSWHFLLLHNNGK